MERRLPVWREEYNSFSRSFKKHFVLDTFQATSVNFFSSRHTKMVKECNEDSGNVQVRKICQFFLDFLMQCNFSAITALLYTIARHSNANVDLQYFYFLSI